MFDWSMIFGSVWIAIKSMSWPTWVIVSIIPVLKFYLYIRRKWNGGNKRWR